jgi:hypothetical protein
MNASQTLYRFGEVSRQSVSAEAFAPWGSWDLSGNWHPNPLLKMSEDEQREQNIKTDS